MLGGDHPHRWPSPFGWAGMRRARRQSATKSFFFPFTGLWRGATILVMFLLRILCCENPANHKHKSEDRPSFSLFVRENVPLPRLLEKMGVQHMWLQMKRANQKKTHVPPSCQLVKPVKPSQRYILVSLSLSLLYLFCLPRRQHVDDDGNSFFSSSQENPQVPLTLFTFFFSHVTISSAIPPLFSHPPRSEASCMYAPTVPSSATTTQSRIP